MSEKMKIEELNDWIAVNVFKWKPCFEEEYPHRPGYINEKFDLVLKIDAPNWSENPAAAMEVLKKCFQNATPTIDEEFDSEEDGSVSHWFVVEDKNTTGSYVESETLELAICLFAKKLFSK